MVFFVCDSCGQAIKKNAVEKHCNTKCHNCQSLSCVDCGKVFWGDDYQQHVKCISEEEKYGGKDYVKATGKAEGKKQNEWLEIVQSAVGKCKDPTLRKWLLMLEDSQNVPRKKEKFKNFARQKKVPYNLIDRLFDSIMAEKEQSASNETKQENGQEKPADDATKPKTENGTAEETKKLSKREKKEERSKATKKVQKKEKHNAVADADNGGKKKKKKREFETENGDEIYQQNGSDDSQEKKKKKRKKDDDEITNGISSILENSSANQDDSSKKKKKKRKKDTDVTNGDASLIEDDSPVQEMEEPKKKKRKHSNDAEENTADEQGEAPPTKKKFKWEDTIISLLEKQDDKEMSVKKLRKKVLAEYHSCLMGTAAYNEDKLLSKFNTKISKNARLFVHKDRVKLKK